MNINDNNVKLKGGFVRFVHARVDSVNVAAVEEQKIINHRCKNTILCVDLAVVNK